MECAGPAQPALRSPQPSVPVGESPHLSTLPGAMQPFRLTPPERQRRVMFAGRMFGIVPLSSPFRISKTSGPAGLRRP